MVCILYMYCTRIGVLQCVRIIEVAPSVGGAVKLETVRIQCNETLLKLCIFTFEAFKPSREHKTVAKALHARTLTHTIRFNEIVETLKHTVLIVNSYFVGFFSTLTIRNKWKHFYARRQYFSVFMCAYVCVCLNMVQIYQFCVLIWMKTPKRKWSIERLNKWNEQTNIQKK